MINSHTLRIRSYNNAFSPIYLQGLSAIYIYIYFLLTAEQTRRLETAKKLSFGNLDESSLIYNRMKSDICKDGKSEMPGSIILIILQM